MKEKIYLAALLHDIGKFGQRAETVSYKNSKYLSSEMKNADSVYCPFRNYFSHIHVLFTAQFIFNNRKLFGNFEELSQGEDTLERVSASHHKPSTFHEQLIQYADKLSAGNERSSIETANEINDTKKFRESPLQSVFSNLNISTSNKKDDFKKGVSWYYKLQRPDNEGAIFPEVDKPNLDYFTLWKEFTEGIEKLKHIKSFFTFQYDLLKHLEKYTSFIPSSTQMQPDVSLFDHLKNVAAFAQALEILAEESIITEIESLKKVEAPFLLVGADISGIQEFIYTILSEDASKNLKGRSFYLHLLMSSINQLILKELGLFHAAIIYESGGKAFIIAPNTPKTIEKLKYLRTQLENAIYQQHRISLFVALEWEEIKKLDLEKGEINLIWKRLTEKLSNLKSKRLLQKIKEFPHEFFTASGRGGFSVLDKVTGEELLQEASEKTVNLSEQLTKLGQQLRDNKLWVTTSQKINKDSIQICGLPIWHTLCDLNELPALPNEYIARSFTKDFIFPEEPYGGYEFPENKDGSIKTFEQLAEGYGNISNSNSLKRLGILRMDVDNLGDQFIKGFREKERTFSRYASLSRSLDLFFKGYINSIRNQKAYKDSVQIVYSGGDDIFAVGQWKNLLDFAEELRNQFRKFVCYHPLVTLSGGMVMIPSKFPVLKAAEMAGEAESLAKSKGNGTKKNAITILNMALGWDDEFPFVMKLKDDIVDMEVNFELPKSFIGFVLSWKASVKEYKNGMPHPLNLIWQSAYTLERMKGRYNEDVKAFLENIKNNIYTQKDKPAGCNEHYLEYLSLAARLAELELRTMEFKNSKNAEYEL